MLYYVQTSLTVMCGLRTIREQLQKEGNVDKQRLFTLHNHDDLLSNSATQGFIDVLRSETSAGYGFIPFIGAGFSVSAGIPIIQQLANYLRRCICMALALEKDGEPEHWNPRFDRWPPFVDRERNCDDSYWELLVRKRYSYARKHKDKDAALYQEAYGAMAEWRTSLSFLSRLVLTSPRSASAQPKVVLGVPQQEVVDACFREVMRHKHPALQHNMLASVSSLLRIDLILTTNFDELIEQAFESSRNPLSVFDVHLSDRLPHYEVVGTARSIIKLHGSQQSLRADYSLDGLPNDEDKLTFLEFMAGRRLGTRIVHAIESEAKPSTRNHLLILGVSGSELRTTELFRCALAAFSDSKVFWVCHSASQFDRIDELAKGISRDRIHVLRHTEMGLFLLHLYQSVRKTLPATGTIFPSNTRLSLPPLPSPPLLQQTEPRKQLFLRAVDKLSQNIKSDPTRTVIAVSAPGIFGLSTVASEVFRRLENENICVWLEMNDIQSSDDLFEAFQEAAYSRLGEQDWTPLYAAKDNRPRGEEVERIVTSSIKPWVLFLNAREVAGANRRHYSEMQPNGWVDEDLPSRQNGTDDSTSFAALVEDMVKASDRMTIVLLCRGLRYNGIEESVKKHLPSKVLQVLQDRNPNISPQWMEEWAEQNDDMSADATVKRVITWADDPVWVQGGTSAAGITPPDRALQMKRSKRRFLMTLTCMQRPRYLSTVWARWIRADDFLRGEDDQHKDKWLYELEHCNLIRRMDGGFIWFRSEVRQKLRRCFELTASESDRCDAYESSAFLTDPTRIALQEWNSADEIAKIHLNLATWYRKVFDATNSVAAVFEIIDHLCFSVRSLIRFNLKRLHLTKPGRTELANLELNIVSRVDAAREVLREQHFLIQAQSHPRVSMRRLDYVRDFWTDEAEQSTSGVDRRSLSGQVRDLFIDSCEAADRILKEMAKLQSKAVEVAMVLAREIGEEAHAYQRLREFGIRRLFPYPLSLDEVKANDEELKTSIRGPNGLIRMGLSERLTKTLNQGREGSESKRKGEMIRWWRSCGILANASRSLREADHSLWRALQASADTNIIFHHDNDLKANDICLLRPELESLKLSLSDSYAVKLEILHTLDITSFHLNLRGQAMKRWLSLCWHELASLDGSKEVRRQEIEGDIHKYMARAELLASKGMNLVEDIHLSGDEKQQDFQLQWCRTRLLMDAGLSMMFEERKFTRHAMSLLGDAALCLHSVTDDRVRSDMALVELQRAEVRLQEAGMKKLPGEIGRDREALQFQVWAYDQLRADEIGEGRIDDPEYPFAAATILRELRRDQSSVVNETIRRVSARAQDALRFLDRAEPLLLERRRNAWWTTWYFERRLRAISLLLWASITESDTPIPFLKLEAAMRKTDTVADVLLEDSFRMIRVDVYRLAMILLEYASCARALQVRLALDPSTVRLPERLQRMETLLEAGLERLDEVETRRNEHEAPTMGEHVNEDTSDFIRDSIVTARKRVRAVIAGLSHRQRQQ
jgi:hypothetical protein